MTAVWVLVVVLVVVVVVVVGFFFVCPHVAALSCVAPLQQRCTCATRTATD